MRGGIGLSVLMVVVLAIDLSGLSGFATEIQPLQVVSLRIDGLTCGACVKDVKAALAKVSGVSSVEILVGKKWVFFSDYANARATVTFDSPKADIESLVKAVEAASTPLSTYKARLLEQ
jgi:mercuric ion binding protein